MSDYPMLISNKLHSFRNFWLQTYTFFLIFSDVLSNKLNNKAFLTISNNFLISKVMFFKKKTIYL